MSSSTLVAVGAVAPLFTNRTSVASLPTSASDGVALPSGIVNLPSLVTELELVANGGNCTLTGPVRVYGRRSATGRWAFLGELNKGGNITLVDGGAGYSEPIQYLSTFERLQLVEGAISANGYDLNAANIDVMGS